MDNRLPIIQDADLEGKTIFVNAVMGFTPHFFEGSKALDETIDKNRTAKIFYGGGDTLQEFKISVRVFICKRSIIHSITFLPGAERF